MDVNQTQTKPGKRYIGIWDNHDQSGDPSETGGIIIDTYGGLMFILRVLNDSGKFDDKRINVYPQEVKNLGYRDDRRRSSENRKRKLAEFLSKLIFIFDVEAGKSLKNGQDNFFAQNIQRLPRNNDFEIDDQFVTIPVFHETDNLDQQKFEDALVDGGSVAFPVPSLVSATSEGFGTFAVFQSKQQHGQGEFGTLYDGVSVKDADDDHIIFQESANQRQIHVRNIDSAKWSEGQYSGDEAQSLMFVPERYLKSKLLNEYAKQTGNLGGVAKKTAPKPIVKEVKKAATKSQKVVNKAPKAVAKHEQATKENVVVAKKMTTRQATRNVVSEAPKQNQELDLIRRFQETVNSKEYGLTLYDNDLINFHNSVKTNLLTILTGLSGTGKSKIVTAYAEALGILRRHNGQSNQFNMISIRPSWNDDADLLGYADTLNNNYRPADSGLLETLIDANHNPDKLYLVVFDEMNLARVEHYFSQFLSVLERRPEDRLITLYSKNIEPRLYNSDKYPSHILVPENVRFVGTMNVDESTFQMSDKLIDRSNTISLRMVPFKDRKAMAQRPSLKKEDFPEISDHAYKDMAASSRSLTSTELDFFWRLNTSINDSLPDVGISWRTLDSIEDFLANAPTTADYTAEVAFDYQVAQRILPKIRGTREMLEELIHFDRQGELAGELVDILNQSSKLSAFPLSRNVLKRKAKELQVNGFAR